jgi:hypothetical protein
VKSITFDCLFLISVTFVVAKFFGRLIVADGRDSVVSFPLAVASCQSRPAALKRNAGRRTVGR